MPKGVRKSGLPPGVQSVMSRGKVRLPDEVVQRFGLAEGSLVQVVVDKDKGEIRIVPVELTLKKRSVA